MKFVYCLLTASLLFAAIPYAAAGHRCDHAGAASEGIAHPTKPDRYLYLDVTRPDKVGEWIENNGVGGLQTSACFVLGALRFGSDAKAALLA